MVKKKNIKQKKIISLVGLVIALFLFSDTTVVFGQVTSTPVYLTEPVEILHLDILVWGIIWFLAIYLFLFLLKLLWRQ
jgi:hypothetical protein